jgi:hypothetical protein
LLTCTFISLLGFSSGLDKQQCLPAQSLFVSRPFNHSMTFEEVISKLTPFLQEYGFRVTETFKNYIKYESPDVTYALSYDERERSFSTFLGKRNGSMALLSGDVLTNVFHEDLSSYKKRSVADNYIYFLLGNGQGLLHGDKIILNRLEEYSNVAAKQYTATLLREQNLREADKAWQEKNYTQFIKLLDQVDKKTLTKSYLKKYEIASKRQLD